MSPALQALLSERLGLGGAVNNAQNALASSLPTGPLNLNFGDTVQNAANAAYGAQTDFLNPQFQLQNKQLQTQLDSRGLPIGSEARTDAENQQANAHNLAYTQAANNAYGAGLAAEQQGYTQAVGQQMLPYQELGSLSASNPTSSLLSQAPGAANLGTTSVQPTDVSGDVYKSYQDQMQAYNQNQTQLFGGLLGLGQLGLTPGLGGALGGAGTANNASLLGYAFSDERLKEDKHKIGELKDGTSLFTFRYRGRPEVHAGVMAQDVEKRHPEAVGEAGGFKTVDYRGLLGAIGAHSNGGQAHGAV